MSPPVDLPSFASGPARDSRRRSAQAVRRDWTKPLAAAEQERREQLRHRMPLRIATLHTEEGGEACVLKNISARGLQAKVYRKLEPGSNISVALSPNERIPAKIIWCRDWAIGVEFLASIDVDEALGSRLTAEDDKDVRLPRLEVSCPGRLQIGQRAYAVRLCDISEGGAKVEMRSAMKKLSSATLTLPGLPPACGYVRWVDGLRLGVGFDEPLPHDVLARWAESRRAKAAPGSEAVALDRTSLA